MATQFACSDGHIKSEQAQACRNYGNDQACCEAFHARGSCGEGGQFYPGSRYDKYCQLTCGLCSMSSVLSATPYPSSSVPYQPTLQPSQYCGDNNFKSAFPMICFVFMSSSACCENYKNDGGCGPGGPFALGGHYHGYCRRSCLYCGPTPIPTLPQPSSAPTTRYPTSSQVPTANCNDGFLLRDARDFLRHELNLSGLCAMFTVQCPAGLDAINKLPKRRATSSTSCCRNLQQHGQCEKRLGRHGELFGYCSRTCGYCGFENFSFDRYDLEVDPPLQLNMDAQTVMGKSVSLAICGVMFVGMLCAFFVALSLFLNDAFHTSNVERRKSAKIVVLSALFFAGAMALVAGASCSPNVDIRHAPATLHDLELKELDLQLFAESVHLSFTAFLSASAEDLGTQNSIMLAGAKLHGRYIHRNKAVSLGTLGVSHRNCSAARVPTIRALGWDATRLQPGSKRTFSSQMRATFDRNDFWGAWMTTDYYNNHLQLEFGPLTAQLDFVPDNFLIAWIFETSDVTMSYSYGCNYTIFVQALFYDSMVCMMSPKANMNDVYGHLKMVSSFCYAFGTVLLFLCLSMQRCWFPPPKPIIAGIECHGEEPHVEARLNDADLSRPLALCALNFDLADVSITDSSGEVILLPGSRPLASVDSRAIFFSHAQDFEEEVRLSKMAYNPAPESGPRRAVFDSATKAEQAKTASAPSGLTHSIKMPQAQGACSAIYPETNRMQLIHIDVESV